MDRIKIQVFFKKLKHEEFETKTGSSRANYKNYKRFKMEP